jgi:feruloyl esterase
MLHSKILGISFVAALALVANGAATSPARAQLACGDLPGALAPQDTTIDSATVTTTGGGAEFCKVLGHISPVPESRIDFVVNLPANWNDRFLMIGDGGHDGVVSGSTRGIDDGFATANSNLGHDAGAFPGATFAFDQPDLAAGRASETDYGWRAVHLTTVVAKEIVAGFYGAGPSYSYFDGCSTGGREAHMEVQRFPADYDGVVDGAAAFDLIGLAMEQNWSMQQTFAHDIGGKNDLIAGAVMAQCDGLDGLVDGLIDDPRRCDFDPASLTCAPGQDPNTCLSAEQVQAVQDIYDGPSNSNGPIYRGKPMGSEGLWSLWIIPPPFGFAAQGGFVFDFMNYLFFENDPGPAFDWRTFDFEADAGSGAFMANTVNATNPDISAFRDRGGKYILYHGSADGLIPPFRTIEYYQQVVETLGGPVKKTQEFARLFMLPGMDHCGAFGRGLLVNDWLTPLVNWVENGVAPDRIIATQFVGVPAPRTRPLCPYPQVARYNGSGDENDAANFSCQLLGLDQADEAGGFENGQQGRNKARRNQ